MKYNQFEDLPVWQEGRSLVNKVYDIIGTSKELAKDFSLMDQLKRAAFPIMLNIAEGFERGGNKEFSNFINIAKGSAGEVRSILYILLGRKYVSEETFEKLKSEVLHITTGLANLRRYLISHQDYKKYQPSL